MDWDNHYDKLLVIFLDWWNMCVCLLQDTFDTTSFHHIYKEFNFDADMLSKRGLDSPERISQFEEWCDKVIVFCGSIPFSKV